MEPNSRLRRGFIILFGSRRMLSNAAEPPVSMRCPKCGQDAQLINRQARTWFTIFFIPIFPMSAAMKFSQCNRCGTQFRGSASQLQSAVGNSDQQQTQQAIGLYNSLRASPANSVTLNQLLTLYASMKEYDQAISAANDFPQALNASEQCMTTLGRILMAQNKIEPALQWLDAAVARNDQLAEAQYFKAVAHMMSTPPNYPAAVTAARAARAGGYPNADELLRQAEAKRDTQPQP